MNGGSLQSKYKEVRTVFVALNAVPPPPIPTAASKTLVRRSDAGHRRFLDHRVRGLLHKGTTRGIAPCSFSQHTLFSSNNQKTIVHQKI
ncbi:Hypothetical protein, putative [Bodo saltans]|uniref:Uncharacterized protein n=1 Tax=Bodo saltans TaxID=75058 RepID=A0A0S4JBL3_BODSA|nr:Hypothetical protein, putative [Bodo saltans]|eukprot:CUG85053.1 Hypothetical protein, putative [Bodo saltans]